MSGVETPRTSYRARRSCSSSAFHPFDCQLRRQAGVFDSGLLRLPTAPPTANSTAGTGSAAQNCTGECFSEPASGRFN